MVSCSGAGLRPDPIAVRYRDDLEFPMEFELMRVLPRTWHMHVQKHPRRRWLWRRQYTTALQLLPDFTAKLRDGSTGEWKVKIGNRKGLEIHTLEVCLPWLLVR